MISAQRRIKHDAEENNGVKFVKLNNIYDSDEMKTLFNDHVGADYKGHIVLPLEGHMLKRE